MKSTWSQGHYWFPLGRHASTTDMKDTSCTSSYNGTHPGSQYHKTFWRTMFWSWVQAAYSSDWLLFLTPTFGSSRLLVCVCVCSWPWAGQLKVETDGSKPRSANALLQCGFPEGLDQGSFLGCTVSGLSHRHLVISCIQLGITSFFSSCQQCISVSCATFDIPHRNSSSHQVFCQWFGLSETCCWSETLEGPMREELTSG